MATRNEALEELHVGDLDIQWLPDQRAWRAQFAGPEILETQLGPNWGSWSTAEGRFIKVAGPVVMKYSHKTPDKVQFIMLRVEFGAPGGLALALEPREDEAPAEDDAF